VIDLTCISARRPATRLGRGGRALALVGALGCLAGAPAASAEGLANLDTTAISGQYQASEPTVPATSTEALVASVREQAAAAVAEAAAPAAPAPTPAPAAAPASDGNSVSAIHQNLQGETSAPPPSRPVPTAAPEAPAVARQPVETPPGAPKAVPVAAAALQAAAATQAAATQPASAAARSAPAAPANINVAINILSPGDRGPVVQTSTGPGAATSTGVTARSAPHTGAAEEEAPSDVPTSWTWTWKWSWGTGCGDGAPSTSPTSTIAGGSWNWSWDWNWDCAPDPPRRPAGLASVTGSALATAPASAEQDAPPSAAAVAGAASAARSRGGAHRHRGDRRGRRGPIVSSVTATGSQHAAPLAGLALLARPAPALAAGGRDATTGPATAAPREPRRHGAPPAPVRPPAQPPIDASSTTSLAGGLGGGGGGGMAAALLLAAVALVSPEIFTRLTAAKAVRRPKPRSSRLDRPG
jgi:hypothetical protein